MILWRVFDAVDTFIHFLIESIYDAFEMVFQIIPSIWANVIE